MSNKQTAQAEAESLAKRVLRGIRRLVGFPLARIRWAAAEDARRQGRWAKMAEQLEAMHEWHWMNDESHFWLGVAYTNSERFDEAVQEFELISNQLDDEEFEQSRWLNFAIALSRTGESGRALEILRPRESIQSRFPFFADQAVELYDSIEATEVS